MPHLPEIRRVSDIRMGKNPALEAWMYHFLTENNLEYLLNPSIVSSPEQLRFMVALRDGQIYLPCDDELFLTIYTRENPGALNREYLQAWRFIVSLVKSYDLPRQETRRILGFCRYRFRLYFQSRVILPSRMIKRLVGSVLTQCGDPDPFREKKRAANGRAAALLERPEFRAMLQACPALDASCLDIPSLRWEVDATELARLAAFSTLRSLWRTGGYDRDAAGRCLEEAAAKCGALREVFGPEGTERKKVLLIPDIAGGFIFDLALARSLLRQGHQVILVLKDAFYFNTPTIWDLEEEEAARAFLEDAHVTGSEALTKNELLRLLREHRFLVISDGTSEQLNLYRTNITFARAWKECDVVLAKGLRNMRLMLGTSHEFTRDVLCWWRDEEGAFHMRLKTRADWIRKFAEKDLRTMSKRLILDMQTARAQGKTVMFYSAIIGSIPGQTKTAISVVNTFVDYLRDRMENTFIINPAEHFEEGMDGDDLMYMWEHVQRSGLLDVWRFQTVEDIETSFALMRSKVPSVWSGKDSTYSTGCTKEMRIALDVQQAHPELQIIGPAPEKFFRRRDYKVGKYYDVSLH